MPGNSLVVSVYNYLLAIGFASQLFMLALQLRAYARNRHISFILLAISSSLCLIYWAITTARYFLQPTTAFAQPSYIAGACVATVQIAMGLWGTISLFNSYDALAQRSGT
jgi:hypothetical protein